MDADAIDSCKENIQPLRSGRKAKQLGIALQAETDSNIQQKILLAREEYELLIRMYDGPDPLQPRFDFVLWLEQIYPKHGKESNLVPLLEDTITIFKDDKKYIQDTRFVSLIIKFIETQVNPLELYQVVYNQGIGTMCAILYKSWAEELDLCGDLKRADQVYQLGISNHAQPEELLIHEHKQFQMSVGRRMLMGDLEVKEEEQEEESQPKRQVLGKLRKGKVGSVRPALGKPGVVPLCLSNRPNSRQTSFHICQDAENEDEVLVGRKAEKVNHLPRAEDSIKENTMKPGTWNKPYRTHPVHHPTSVPITPKFIVHEDPDTGLVDTARPISQDMSALKTKRAGDIQCPMAIFEPPDPSVQPMYCKHLIYAGGRELQLEEIRAAIYIKGMREQIAEEEMKKLGITNFNDLGLKSEQRNTSLGTPTLYKLGGPTTPMIKEFLKQSRGNSCSKTPINPKIDEEPEQKFMNRLDFACSDTPLNKPKSDISPKTPGTQFRVNCDKDVASGSRTTIPETVKNNTRFTVYCDSTESKNPPDTIINSESSNTNTLTDPETVKTGTKFPTYYVSTGSKITNILTKPEIVKESTKFSIYSDKIEGDSNSDTNLSETRLSSLNPSHTTSQVPFPVYSDSGKDSELLHKEHFETPLKKTDSTVKKCTKLSFNVFCDDETPEVKTPASSRNCAKSLKSSSAFPTIVEEEQKKIPKKSSGVMKKVGNSAFSVFCDE